MFNPSQRQLELRALIAGVLFVAAGIFFLVVGLPPGDTRGIPNSLAPWVVIACGAGLLYMSGTRVR